MIEIFDYPKESVAFTIGMFDGVHLGHRSLLDRLKQTGKKTLVMTFIPHPAAILRPQHTPPLQITTHAQKKALIAECGIDFLLTIPFTLEFAALSFSQLLAKLSFTHLILGLGATFGAKREGTEERVRAWVKNTPAILEYLPKFELDGIPVSSTHIRNALLAKDRTLAERLLGYPLTRLEETHV